MKALFPVQVINVGLDFGTGRIPVGRLALRERRIYFEYSPSFIEQGLEISPFLLSVKSGVTTFDNSLFEGLPGVFNDSLPDGWVSSVRSFRTGEGNVACGNHSFGSVGFTRKPRSRGIGV